MSYDYESGEFGKEEPQMKPNFADTSKCLQIEVIFDAQIQITFEVCGAAPW